MSIPDKINRFKTTIFAVFALLGATWYGVTFADEIIKNAQEVPELKKLVQQNALALDRLIEERKLKEDLIVQQNKLILDQLSVLIRHTNAEVGGNSRVGSAPARSRPNATDFGANGPDRIFPQALPASAGAE